MTLVYKAVQRGYAVVAMGAHRGGDKWRCYETHWPPEEHPEIPGVCPALHHACTHAAFGKSGLSLTLGPSYDGALWRLRAPLPCLCVVQPRMLIPWAQPAMPCNMFRAVETVQMIRVIRHVLLEKGWWHLPRYVYGSSSGGCIALELAMRFPLQVCAYLLHHP